MLHVTSGVRPGLSLAWAPCTARDCHAAARRAPHRAEPAGPDSSVRHPRWRAADPSSRDPPSQPPVRSPPMGRVVVDVMPKPEILDPQGKAVAGALAGSGSPSSPPPARASGSSSRWTARSPPTVLERAREAAATLLSNPVIEDVVRVAALAEARRRVSGDVDGPAIGVVTFPGSLDDGTPPARCGSPAARRSRSGTPTTTCAASTRSSCPAASPTATTCAAARSPGSPPVMPVRRAPPPSAGCRCSASATGSRCCARRTCCPARWSATTRASSSAATSGCGSSAPTPPGRPATPRGEEIVVPLKNGEGGYVADARTLDELEGEGRVVVRYLPTRQPERLVPRHRRHQQRRAGASSG